MQGEDHLSRIEGCKEGGHGEDFRGHFFIVEHDCRAGPVLICYLWILPGADQREPSSQVPVRRRQAIAGPAVRTVKTTKIIAIRQADRRIRLQAGSVRTGYRQRVRAASQRAMLSMTTTAMHPKMMNPAP